jgi:hypothetical protein
MTRIKWLWNLMFYNLYLFELKTNKVYKYLNPFFWGNKIGDVIKRLNGRRTNYDSDESRINLIERKYDSIFWAKIYIAGLLAIIECSLLNVVFGHLLWSRLSASNLYFFLFLFGISVSCSILNNYLLYKEKRFVLYFQEFEKMDPKKKNLYGWICFFIIIIVTVSGVYSFTLKY